MTEKHYLVILERGDTSWGAYCPDVSGCIAVGGTREEALRLFEEALQLYIEGAREDGDPIPEPVSEAASVAIKVGMPVAA